MKSLGRSPTCLISATRSSLLCDLNLLNLLNLSDLPYALLVDEIRA